MGVVAELPEPPGLPVLGHGPALARGGVMHRTLFEWQERYGDTYRIRIGPQPAVVSSSPGLVETVLRERPKTFRRASYLSDVIDELGGHGLFNAEGEDWRRLRRSAAQGLNASSLRGAFPAMVRSTARLRDDWKARAGERVAVLDDLMLHTLEVITALTLGDDLDAVRRRDQPGLHKRLPLLASTVVRRMYSPVPYWRWLRLPVDRRADAVVAEVRELVARRFDGVRERMAAGQQPANYLEALVKSALDAGEPLTALEAAGAVLNMLVAGEDNTAAQVSWAIHHLARNPGVQAKVRAETAEHLGDQDIPSEATVLSRMRYVKAVVDETMRLSPPSPHIIMEALHDTTLPDGLHLEAGTVLVLLLSRGAETDAERFPEPHEFRPERWLSDVAPAQSPAGSPYLPFGGGPRFCPGRNLALVESMLLVAMVCHHFEIEPDTEGGPVGERVTLSVFPTNLGVRLKPVMRAARA
jgi:cytochrome P450